MRNTLFLLDLRNGYFEEHRVCGDLERTDIEYQEGCDSIDVPYDAEICYCKQNLCNGSTKSVISIFLIVLTILIPICNSK